MPSKSEFREAREAVDAVFASGLLKDAPNMAQLLSHVCTKYFEGQQDQLKEYNIAVEGFGRPPGFDQKRDSIVRVEAHRLRKRLNEFYEGEGLTHKVKIVIPVGHYVPQFVTSVPEVQPEFSAAANTPEDFVAESSVTPPAMPALALRDLIRSARLRVWLWWASAAVAAVYGAVVFLAGRPHSASIPAPTTAAIATNSEDIRILAGWTKGPYTDPFGHVWQADRYGTGGYFPSPPMW